MALRYDPDLGWYDDGQDEPTPSTDPGFSIWAADEPSGQSNQVITYEDGSTLILDRLGNPIASSPATDTLSSTTSSSSVDLLSMAKKIGADAFNALKGAFTKNGSVDWRALATLGGMLYGATSGSGGRSTSSGAAGYQGGIPKYMAVREAVPQTYDPTRRPGSGGRRYFTDMQYVPKTGEGAAGALTAAQTAAQTQAQGLASLNRANPLNAPPPAYQPPAAPPVAAAPATPEYNPAYSGESVLNTVRELLNPPKQMAQGGIVGLQDGGFVVPADVVSHLGNGSTRAGLAFLAPKGAVPIQGRGDGMSDSNRTMINGEQPAAVADGEAYFGPEEVAALGGAQALYSMMDKIRKDRTGTTKQGRQINPNKYV